GWRGGSRRRGGDRFARAVAGGCVPLSYLSILAAFQLYNLVSGPVAFAGLIAITAAAGVLAAIHRSPALTVLSLVGAYLNPFLASHAGQMSAVGAFVYLLAVDSILVLVATKRWSVVEKLALAGTIIVFGAVQGGATTPQDL